jgi:hypothetical protein
VEHEGIDRTVITWPGVQEQMILQTAQCSAGPVILVVFGGGPIDLTSMRDSKLISAILVRCFVFFVLFFVLVFCIFL